jgi:predicted nucleic acid-binding protein
VTRVLIDTDVLLDIFATREPFHVASTGVLDAVARGAVEGFVAAHAVTTLEYLLSRARPRLDTRRQLERLLSVLTVAPVTGAVISRALTVPIDDFENAVTAAAALEVGASVIVTRNVRDFRNSVIPAALPEMFLTSIHP